MLRFGTFTRTLLAAGFCMAVTPVAFTVGPMIETQFFPVVRDTEILNERRDDDGVSFSVRFRKVRQCDVVSIVWYRDEIVLPVEVVNEDDRRAEPQSLTRPLGTHRAGPWRIPRLRDLKRTRAYALHRCHPLWLTVTDFYHG